MVIVPMTMPNNAASAIDSASMPPNTSGRTPWPVRLMSLATNQIPMPITAAMKINGPFRPATAMKASLRRTSAPFRTCDDARGPDSAAASAS